jgi:hypothetical protein
VFLKALVADGLVAVERVGLAGRVDTGISDLIVGLAL